MTLQSHLSHHQIMNPAPDSWAPAPAPLDMPQQVLERSTARLSPIAMLRLLLTGQSA